MVVKEVKAVVICLQFCIFKGFFSTQSALLKVIEEVVICLQFCIFKGFFSTIVKSK